MAKKSKNEKFDLDNDIDDLDIDGMLDDIDFGDPVEPPPPKNKREAVERTVKDFGKGAKDALLDDKLATLGKVARASVPTQMSSEVSDVVDIYSTLKDSIDKNVSSLKKEVNGTVKAINRLVPENSKIANILKKISGKLSDQDEAIKRQSKEQIENEKIQVGILEALGEMKSAQSTDAAVKATIDNKRHIDSITALRSIYAELKVQRDFTTKITNSYYRKSLELQYRSLFVQKELFELTKASHDTFKKQFESLIKNTSLPDFVKMQNTEVLKSTLRNRATNALIDTMFKRFNPIETIKKNIESKISSTMDDFIMGLSGVNMAVDSLADIRDMNREFGKSSAYAAGEFVADNTIGLAGRIIGDKITATDRGKRGIYRFKNAVHDIGSVGRDISSAGAKREGWLGKAQTWLGDFITDMAGRPDRTNLHFSRQDLDQAAIFDGRAHSSIVKIIPGLLSKIYGEVKTVRTGLGVKGDPTKHEIKFDHRDDKFRTAGQMVKQIQLDLKANVSNTLKKKIDDLVDIYKKLGVNISKKELNSFYRDVTSFMMSYRSSVNASTLYSENFINSLSNQTTKDKITKNINKIYNGLYQEAYLVDEVNWVLSDIRESIPSYTSRFDSLYKSGHGDVLERLGVAEVSPTSGTMRRVNGSMENMVLGAFGGKAQEFKEEEQKSKKKRKLTPEEKHRADILRKKKRATGLGPTVPSHAKHASDQSKSITEVITNMDPEDINIANLAEVADQVDMREVARKVKDKTKKRAKEAAEKANEIAESVKTSQTIGAVTESVLNTTRKYDKKIWYGTVKSLPGIFGKVLKLGGKGLAIGGAGLAALVAAPILGVTKLISSAFTKHDEDEVDQAEKSGKLPSGLEEGTRKIMDAVTGQSRSFEDIKQEFFESEEYKSGKVDNVFTYIKAMGYKLKPDLSVKNILKFTRKWDKKIWGATFGNIPKLVGKMFKFGGKGLKLGAKISGKVMGGLAKHTGTAILDLLGQVPLGLGKIMLAPFSLMNKTLELVGLKESADAKEKKDSDRKGSWKNRLKNLFSRNKNDKDGKKSGLIGGIGQFLKDHKGLTIGMGVMAIMGLMKVLNVSMDDVIKGVKGVWETTKTVASGIKSVASTVYSLATNIVGLPIKAGKYIIYGIRKALSVVPGLGGLAPKDENGKELSFEDMQKEVEKTDSKIKMGVGLGMAGAGLYGARHPIKALKGLGKATIGTGKLAIKGVNAVRGVNAASTAVDATSKVVKADLPDKGKLWDGIKNAAKALKERLSSPLVRKKVAKKGLGKIIKNVLLKLGKMLAGTALQLLPVIGTAIGAGLIGYEIYKIIDYMREGYGIGGALSMTLLGINIFGDEYDPKRIEEEEKSANKSMDVQDTKSYRSATSKYRFTKDQGTALRGGKFEGKGAEDIASGNVKNDFPNFTSSPYITPMPQSSLHGLRANVLTLDDDFRSRLDAFAEEYYAKTGKKLKINSGYRSYDQQKYLYDLYKSGKGNLAANPDRNGPHMRGLAADIQWQSDGYFGIPGQGQYKKEIDETLAKYGLYRPLYKKGGERQHVQLMSGNLPVINESDNISKTSKDNTALKTTSTSTSNTTTTAPVVKTTYNQATTPASQSATKDKVIRKDTEPLAKNIADVLSKQLQVQTKILSTLMELNNKIKEPDVIDTIATEPKQEQVKQVAYATSTPEPALSLKRRETF